MTWELVSFLILAAVLIGGFAWYERSRPPAQVVALVAALAALAIAGRIAFAAFPNVKPTTDIVVLAGFALGAAPGFAVGALTALVSNFWFGQGPWTPWQMAGWGMCGVIGALLALGFRNAGRFTLALACGFAGIAYGALMNFSLMATYGGELSWERFGVLMARAIPFDVAHIVANVALALVAGPAMVRMLTRFRRRFEWRRGGAAGSPGGPHPPADGGDGPSGLRPVLRGAGIAAALVVLLAALAPSPAQAAGAQSAVEWLRSVQNADGGFGTSPGEESGPEMTSWVMLGVAAAGVNPHDLAKGKNTPVSYLRSQVGDLERPGDVARTILALLAAGANPRDFGGRNLVANLHARRRANGSFLGWTNSTAYSVIALRAADSPGGTGQTMDWLRKTQNEDGGWGIGVGQRSDAESTASVLQALSPGSKASQRALEYMRKTQQSNGGYRIGGSGVINTQAAAWAIQGILAAGADPSSFKRGGKTPLDYIEANQAPDGHYRYSKQRDETPIWVTGHVLPAVTGKFFPIAAPPRAPKPKARPARTGGAAAPAPGSASDSPRMSEALPVPSQSPAAPAAGSAGSAGSAGAPPAIPPGADQVPPGSTPQPGEGPGRSADAPGPDSPAAADAEQPPAAETAAASGADGEDSGASVAGSIVFGLLAGGLLFGLGLLGRKGWMRWRYGL